MLREILALLPDVLLRCRPGAAVAWAALGVVLWLIGARHSRSILALVAVAAGTVLGMRLPGWRGWHIDGMSLAVGGAIGLGTIAFLFHRGLITLLLGGGMMLWAGMGTWIFRGVGTYWDWHSVQWDGDMVDFFGQAWRTLPPELSRVLPLACLCGLSAGIALALMLPKLGKVLAHSLIGVTLTAVMGAIAMMTTRPKWLTARLGSMAAQGILLIGLVIGGAMLQWWLTPPHRGPGSNSVRNA